MVELPPGGIGLHGAYAYIGNSPEAILKHHASVTDKELRRVALVGFEAVQNPVQHRPVPSRIDPHGLTGHGAQVVDRATVSDSVQVGATAGEPQNLLTNGQGRT